MRISWFYSDPVWYNSLQAALAESNLPMLNHAGAYMEGVEDLSMSRQLSEDMDGDEDYRDDDNEDDVPTEDVG